MKNALLLFAILSINASTFAADGDIIFANRNVPKAAGDGSTYNIPIWNFPGGPFSGGAGSLPGGVTVGLFLQGATTPLATAGLRTDANSQFFGTPSSQTVTIPGHAPGTTAILDVKAWQGPGTFENAQAGGRWYLSTTFQTRPLGGTPAGGGLPITTPGMTGWGFEDSSGFMIIPEPSTLALAALGLAILLRRRR